MHNIDNKEFENLINLGLTEEDICDYFMISKQVLYNWVKETYKIDAPYRYIKKLRAKAKVSFLAEQRKVARGEMGGNPTVSIWIGKNYFGQNDPDKHDQEQTIYVQTNPLKDLLGIKDKKEEKTDANSRNELN